MKNKHSTKICHFYYHGKVVVEMWLLRFYYKYCGKLVTVIKPWLFFVKGCQAVVPLKVKL